MKLGLILESPKDGTDHQVYKLVIERLRSNLEVVVTGFRNRKDMIAGCGMVAKLSLETGCDSVAIIWDLMPPWKPKSGQPCRHNDKEEITESLRSVEVDLSKIKLICIEPELEGWLLADGAALTAFKAQSWPPHRVRAFKGRIVSDNCDESKKFISKYLERKYSDISDAKRIVAKITDFDRLARKHQSFKRFKEFVEGL